MRANSTAIHAEYTQSISWRSDGRTN
jgi:hypothetical protein